MNTYELINPSDEITFLAENDKIAYVCAIVISNGKFGCKNIDTDESLNTFLFMDSDPEKTIVAFLEQDFHEFIKENESKISKAFSTFAYVSAGKRLRYDEKLSSFATTEEADLYKTSYEEENRSSMNKIVTRAWEFSKKKMSH